MAIKVRKEMYGSHAHLDVFIGPNMDNLAKAGHLVVRANEAQEVEHALTAPYSACGCGRTYTEATWKELKLVGPMPSFDDDGKDIVLELRNCCACYSTLAVVGKS